MVFGLALTLVGARPVCALSLHNMKPLVEETLAPGETVQGSIEVENTGNLPVNVKAYLQDWRYTAAGDGNKTFAAPGTMPRSSANWISFYPQEFSLPPRGRGLIDYTLRVPKDPAPEGGYYAVLFVESKIGEAPNPLSPEGTGATVQFAARLGSLFFVNVKGTVNREGHIALQAPGRPAPGRPLALQGALANDGNAFLKCAGSFHIMGSADLVVARGELPTRYVWPGEQVPVSGEWSGTLPPGPHTVVLTYDCGEDLVLVEEAPLP